jgi:hypothetical protein
MKPYADLASAGHSGIGQIDQFETIQPTRRAKVNDLHNPFFCLINVPGTWRGP